MKTKDLINCYPVCIFFLYNAFFSLEWGHKENEYFIGIDCWLFKRQKHYIRYGFVLENRKVGNHVYTSCKPNVPGPP